MPVLHRRNAKLGPRGTSSTRTSTESTDSGTDRVQLTERDFLQLHKQTANSTEKGGELFVYQKSRNNLFDLYTKSEIPDHYQSSEEESSPIQDDEADTLFDAVDVGATDFNTDHDHTTEASMDYEWHPDVSSIAATAIAVTFFAAGRPKLIDITTIAPIQKRKRSNNNHQTPAFHKPLISRYHSPVRRPSVPTVAEVDEHLLTNILPAHGDHAHSLPKRKGSLASFGSMLSEETAVESEHKRHVPSLELRPTPSYLDYDPYLLRPPRLVSSPSASSHNRRRSRGSSGSSGSSMTTPTYIRGWKGFTKTLGTARPPMEQAGKGKRSGPVVKGGNERDGPSLIPPFPFEESGSPRMQIPVA